MNSCHTAKDPASPPLKYALLPTPQDNKYTGILTLNNKMGMRKKEEESCNNNGENKLRHKCKCKAAHVHWLS